MKDRLFTPSYYCMLSANFLLYFGFWLLVPVLPFYLKESFECEEGIIGIVLSCYTVSALLIRPFSGYLLDAFARKPLYLLAYFVFTSIFAGYIIGGTLTFFILLRIVDPENKSLTLNDTAFACIFTTFSELFTWSFGPMMLLNGQHWLFIGIQVAIMTVCLIVNLVMKWWWIKEPLNRPAVGEDGY